MESIHDTPRPRARPESAPVASTSKREEKPKVVRNRVDKNREAEIQRLNKIHQAKLRNIKREPPSTFHAPNGFKSLAMGPKGRKERDGMRDDTMPGKPHHVGVVPWPPRPKGMDKNQSTYAKDRAQRAAHAKAENMILAGKMEEKYRAKKDTYASNTGCNPVDCTPRFALRTSTYLPPESKQRVQSAKPAAKGIPKSLGFAICSGCGRKGFSGADGVDLKPCQACGQVYYCSATCARVDWTSHKALCKYKTNGQSLPFGTRTAKEYWVTNGGIARAREILRNREKIVKRHGITDPFDEQELMEELVEKAMMKEAKAQAKQDVIEKRAYDGLDGPRPCMYQGGKRV